MPSAEYLLALEKIKHYCAYQERCQAQVRQKLKENKVHFNDIDNIICDLIEENFLNEERFAILFAGGKFRTKQWGKVKIKYELTKNQIGKPLIIKALQQIDASNYFEVAHKLAHKYYNNCPAANSIAKKIKTKNYLLQKGYELNIVLEIMNDIK
jgi:regulatory protein